ncbi:MAG: hypothetical protein SFU98_02395 [Leptospiraceae bacterium]|nr:hypothetical protein [Leptospiraceae bacterium]
MKGLLKKLFSSNKKNEESPSPSFKPLEFTETAIQKIQNQLSSRPNGVESCFKVQVNYKPDRAFVQVGFDEWKNQSTIFDYPVRIQITEKDELFLRGFTIEFSEEDQSFYIYPNVEFIAEPTPKKNIVRFVLNRNIIHPNSKEKEFIFGVGMKQEISSPLIQSISNSKGFSSMYITENKIQIEFLPDLASLENEEKVASILLDHFERKGYPLFIENGIATEVY